MSSVDVELSSETSGIESNIIIEIMTFTNKHPELMNAIITALLWGLGDIISQLFDRHTSLRSTHMALPQSSSQSAPSSSSPAPAAWRFNVSRLLRLTSFAFLLFAPITKAWFEFLVFVFPGEGMFVAFERMLLDQLVYAACVISSLFVWIGLWESRGNLSHVQQKLRANFWPSLKANWMLWPWVQLLNQGVVPLQHRMVVAALVNIPWTAYLAWRASAKTTSTSAPVMEMSRV